LKIAIRELQDACSCHVGSPYRCLFIGSFLLVAKIIVLAARGVIVERPRDERQSADLAGGAT
jgi:hypothetical protein